MTTYYNELDAYPAQWLRNLAAAGEIPAGDVDERDIRSITDYEKLRGYQQGHFFAGIGVWAYALKEAGFPTDVRVWTGSCPCQPFSAAGKKLGTDDARHLWPDWFKLIRECRPECVFGEQVASDDGLAWLDIVYDALEGAGYTVWAVDMCAAGYGAPHIRQRLYFVAVASSERRNGKSIRLQSGRSHAASLETTRGGASGVVGHAEVVRVRTLNGKPRASGGQQEPVGRSNLSGVVMGDPEQPGLEGRRLHGLPRNGEGRSECPAGTPSHVNGFWSDAIWLPCTDGLARCTKPGLQPMAPRAPGDVAKIRAYGNALCAPQAIGFVKAAMELLWPD